MAEVQIVLETEKRIAPRGRGIEVARELGIIDGTLGYWISPWRRDGPGARSGPGPVERGRVKEDGRRDPRSADGVYAAQRVATSPRQPDIIAAQAGQLRLGVTGRAADRGT
jgi:transposase-like protein